jgi:hypothetical protein
LIQLKTTFSGEIEEGSEPVEGPSRPACVFQNYNDSGVSTDSSDVKAKNRKSDPTSWKSNIRKDHLNKGQEYQTTGGALKPAKARKLPCAMTCRQKCREKVTEEQRQKIFESFDRTSDKTRQWDFLVNHVKSLPQIILLRKTE